MAALAPILLTTLINPSLVTTDAAIGVNKTFAPEGWKQGNVASWVDRSGGIPLGYARYTYALRPPTKESRVYKLSGKLYFPVLETIDPATGIFGPKMAYELQAHLDCLIPERATSLERSNFYSLLISTLALEILASDTAPKDFTGAPMRPGILNLEDVY